MRCPSFRLFAIGFIQQESKQLISTFQFNILSKSGWETLPRLSLLHLCLFSWVSVLSDLRFPYRLSQSHYCYLLPGPTPCPFASGLRWGSSKMGRCSVHVCACVPVFLCVCAHLYTSACTYVVRGQVRVEVVNPCEKSTTGWKVNNCHCVLRKVAQESALLVGLVPGELGRVNTCALGLGLRFHSRVRVGRAHQLRQRGGAS